MPRDGSGVYSAPAGSLATPNTPIESARHNALVNDLVQDANTARPVSAGGTGAGSAQGAIDSLFGAARTIGDERLLVVDPSDPSKRLRLDAGAVTPGQTRVLTAPDYDYMIGATITGVRVLAGSGTYAPTVGTRKIVVEAVGGGGGGGHGNSSPGGVAAAGGGGGGEYVRHAIVGSLESTYPYVVGSGGSGGSSSAASGSAGGDTSFGTGPLVLAKGGSGGTGNNNQTADVIGGGGGAGGYGGTGDLKVAGENGDYGQNWGGSVAFSGKGGRAVFSPGGAGCREGVAQGIVHGYGGGGGGGCGSSGTPRGGAAGADGVIYVWEFG